MNFEQWLSSRGIDQNDLTPATETALRRMFADESNIPVARPFAGGRVDLIASEHIRQWRNNPEKVAKLEALQAQAHAEGWDDRQTENAFIRASRFDGPVTFAHSGERNPASADIFAASLAVSYGHNESDVAKWFKDQRVADAAFSRGNRGMTLHGLLRIALQSVGEQAPRGKFSDQDIRKAFQVGGAFMGGVGPSTIDVTGVLSNLANKSLLQEYVSVPVTWSKFCKITSVNDFKEATQYRVTTKGSLSKIAPSGELPHVSMEESSATAQADTYGAMLGLTRTQIINDDLQAFAMAPRSLARLATIGLEKAVYVTLLGEISTGGLFDPAGTNNNYDAGATDSVLSLAGLDNANAIFSAQVDANGDPLYVAPKVLLVPPVLGPTARTLMNATELMGGSTTNAPNNNPWAGLYEVVESPYISNTSITGYTSTGWFLMAPPSDFSPLQVAFLQGQQSPMVEQGEFNFNQLGVAFRVVWDWGISTLDHRGGVHLKGAA